MWGPIIAAGIGAGGSLLGGAISSAGQAEANSANQWLARERMNWEATQAQKQMDFQERMSNTAYQRAMSDMKAAGLNPILAYQQGGASSPAGAMASASAATMENAAAAMGEGVTNAAQAGARFMELKNLAAQTDNTQSQEGLNKANADLSKVNAVKATQETATSAAQQRRADAETALAIEQMENPAAARALMAGQAASAHAAAGLANIQTQQLKEFGPGRLATEIASPFSRAIQYLRDNVKVDASKPNKTASENYKGEPKWMPDSTKVFNRLFGR